ncbi:hypothetical protein QTI66_32800 [Variovorax sp. J22R133]|uniref:hypothetical protein n=1 Tax=Variovorax brevis TaxID=3053503 RepID=UPI0025751670|nr:hypothetical protein [Variovorax sp. J22R133]MDM0116908.1 hypothetical protein [Variovorax sp. J22R133]
MTRREYTAVMARLARLRRTPSSKLHRLLMFWSIVVMYAVMSVVTSVACIYACAQIWGYPLTIGVGTVSSITCWLMLQAIISLARRVP